MTLAAALPRLRHAPLAWTAVAAAGALAVAAVVLAALWHGRATPPGHVMHWTLGLVVPLWVAVAVVGALILTRHPGHLVGRLFLVAGVATPLAVAADAYAVIGLYVDPGSLPAPRLVGAFVAAWFLGPPLVAGALLVLIPDGRPHSRGWAVAGGVVTAGLLVHALALALDNPEDFPGAASLLGLDGLGAALSPAVLALPAGAVVGVAAIWVRAARGPARDRPRLRPLAWVALLQVVAFAACLALGAHGALHLQVLAGVVLVLGCLAAMSAHGLWDLDGVLNRTLVYGALTAAVVAVFGAVVIGLGTALAARESVALATLGTAAGAAVAFPLRDAVQRRVDRLMYGDRRDPSAALRTLGYHLAVAPAPQETLPAIAAAVADALRVPYAAVALDSPTGAGTLVAHGEPPPERPQAGAPLTHRGAALGRLMVAPRAGEELTGAELDLLADLARHAGPAVAALGLTHELERSRRRLVTAREEERRRLRNDLHDGLGPALATLALQVDLARRRLPEDEAGSDARLADLRAGLDEALADVRRLVYGLRPPALDDLGLAGALEEQAARLAGLGWLEVNVRAPVPMAALPAATEVAAFRIAQEAITNALRHSGAARLEVRLSVADRLTLEVVDDGRGIAPETVSGVGLRSMRERAAEVGGALDVLPAPGGGTLVRAVLPLVDPEGDDDR